LIEPIAFVLAIAMVVCNIRQLHWGWPLAIVSSLMYAWVFLNAKLYGEAALQIVFVALAGWGWHQWLMGKVGSKVSSANPALRLVPKHLSLFQAIGVVFLDLVLWFFLTGLLARWTDSDVPIADAFVTSGSLVATLLLGCKYTANWAFWLIVNVVSVTLFVYKGLWLSAALYALLAVMSVYGWQQWRQAAVRSSQTS
jgi:nicotinamide mononucleotide transporter